MKKKIIFFALAVLHMSLIFAFSAQNATASSNTSNEFIKYIVGLFCKNVSDRQMYIIIESIEFVVRKLAHFSIYLVLGVFVYLFLSQFNLSKVLLFTVLWCFLYAVTDEIHQYFVPGRACRLLDVFIDTSGAAVGMALCLLFTRIKKLYKKIR